MKFLLIQPPLLCVNYKKLPTLPGHLLPIFSYLRLNNPGLQVDVLDCLRAIPGLMGGGNKSTFSESLKRELKRYAPDVLGISCYTSMHYTVTKLIAMIFKEENPGGVVIVGGFHATAMPADFGAAGAPFDYVVQGEGEIALSRLLKQPLKPRDQASIIQGTPLALETEELLWDEFPYLHKGDKIILFLSRGCPFHCNFCLEPLKAQISGHKYRAYSSPKARRTIETMIKKLRPREVLFGDAVFGLHPHWRRQFLKELRKIAADIPLWAETRIDILTREDVDLLKSLRFRMDLGLDAVVEENILRQNKSRDAQGYIEQFLTLDNHMNLMEIPHSVYMLYNYPGETPETYSRTRQFLLDIGKKRSYNYTCFVGQPFCLYPGTQSYRDMKHYEEAYGSRFPNDGWWRRVADDQYALARDIVASREMEGEEIDFWADMRQLFNATSPDIKLAYWPHDDYESTLI